MGRKKAIRRQLMNIVIDKHNPFITAVLEPVADVVCLEGGKIDRKDPRDAETFVVRIRARCNGHCIQSGRN